MRNKLFFLTGLLVSLATVAPLGATSVRILRLEEMVQSAERVFRGRCISARTIPAVAGLDATEYTFEISEGVKGTTTGQQIVFRQVAAPQAGKRGIAGIPAYSEGEDLLIFLHGEGRLGLTSPVGFSQGVFHIVPGGKEGVRVVNGMGNRNLMMGGVLPAADFGLNGEEISLLSQGGDLPLRTLTSAIRKIERYQETRRGSAQ